MYVCICAAVTDRQVVAAVENGADTLEKLGFELGLGLGCGCCRDQAQQMIDGIVHELRRSRGDERLAA